MACADLIQGMDVSTCRLLHAMYKIPDLFKRTELTIKKKTQFLSSVKKIGSVN